MQENIFGILRTPLKEISQKEENIMKRTSSHPFLKIEEETAEKEEEESEEETDDIAERFKCMSLHKREFNKREEELSLDKYGLWKQEQKIRAARTEKQLRAKWELDELIEDHLRQFDAKYNRAMVPSSLKDLSHLLAPKWTPPWEMASLAWLGDCRPSAILNLIRSLSRSPTSLLSLSDSSSSERLLSQLIHETRIEEAVLDEEMAEIQATCILHLPFVQTANKKSAAAMACVHSEFKKIEPVITKAQQLRYKTLELAVKKLLSQTEAAEFLVAFAGIQDTVHQFAAQQRLRKGPVSVPTTKALGV